VASNHCGKSSDFTYGRLWSPAGDGWFIGHPDAEWRSAVSRRSINPQDYLTDVLSRLPSMKNHEVKDLLPSRWKPQRCAPNTPASRLPLTDSFQQAAFEVCQVATANMSLAFARFAG
jgi:transposase IS66-like protein